MIGILFATEREAAPFLGMVTSEKHQDSPFITHVFRTSGHQAHGFDGVVLIAGIGPAAAEAGTRHLLDQYRRLRVVVNAGICGALGDAPGVGDIVRISEARLCRDIETGDGDPVEVLAASPASLWPELPTARLVTSPVPVFDPDLRVRLAALGECVDQEGAVVAALCHEQGLACHLLKGVSDLADHGGRDALMRNIDSVSARIAELLLVGISAWDNERPGVITRVTRFVKLEHTALSLPLVFSGAWLGQVGHMPRLTPLLLIALAGTGARTFGMAMNRIADRRLDMLNPRTAIRDLPRGHMSLPQAIAVACGGVVLYLVACALLGRVCLLLSPIPLVPLLGYSYLKRFTSLCHFGIGVCLALGPLGAYVATSGGVDASPAILLLALFTFCWVSAFDIIYALQDIDSDRATGVHSLPARLGAARAQMVAAGVHLVAFASIAGVAWVTGGGMLSWICVALAGLGLSLAYAPWMPLQARFFPQSAIVGVIGALVPFLGRHP